MGLHAISLGCYHQWSINTNQRSCSNVLLCHQVSTLSCRLLDFNTGGKARLALNSTTVFGTILHLAALMKQIFQIFEILAKRFQFFNVLATFPLQS